MMSKPRSKLVGAFSFIDMVLFSVPSLGKVGTFVVAEVVKCYTFNDAYAEFAEKEKGSLEVGKLTDSVMLSDDIFAIEPVQIREVKLAMTVVGAKVVLENNW